MHSTAIILLALALLLIPARAQRWSDPVFIGAVANAQAAGGAPPSYLLYETFDAASGYDNAGWTDNASGIIDPDYTTSPAPLEGTQSLYVNYNVSGPEVSSPSWAAVDSVIVRFQINFPTDVSAPSAWIENIRNSGGLSRSTIRIKTSGVLNVYDNVGGENDDGSTTLVAGTTYYLWHSYTKGSGSNAVHDIWIGTNSIFAESTLECHIDNGSSTDQSVSVVLRQHLDALDGVIFDQVWVATNAPTGDTP